MREHPCPSLPVGGCGDLVPPAIIGLWCLHHPKHMVFLFSLSSYPRPIHVVMCVARHMVYCRGNDRIISLCEMNMINAQYPITTPGGDWKKEGGRWTWGKCQGHVGYLSAPRAVASNGGCSMWVTVWRAPEFVDYSRPSQRKRNVAPSIYMMESHVKSLTLWQLLRPGPSGRRGYLLIYFHVKCFRFELLGVGDDRCIHARGV